MLLNSRMLEILNIANYLSGVDLLGQHQIIINLYKNTGGARLNAKNSLLLESSDLLIHPVNAVVIEVFSDTELVRFCGSARE